MRGNEVVRDVPVEEDEDEQRDEEEDGDDEDEVELGPRVVHGGQADRGRLRRVLDHGEDGRGEAEGEQPRDQAGQARLRLGPHHAGLFGVKQRLRRWVSKGNT